MTRAAYDAISIAGGDTATPHNLVKRLAFIERWLRPLDSVLDAGCGAGEYVAALRERGYDAHGIEYDASKVATWQSKHPGDPRVRRGDLVSIPFPDGRFDVVLLNEVLEHVPDERAVLREIRRVLRVGGQLILMAPNRRYPFETHGYDNPRTGQRVAPIKTLFWPWLPRSLVHRFVRPWARNYWPHELQRLVRAAGFDVRETGYLWQTFENISGRQPVLIGALKPLLLAIAHVLEHTPLLRTFGGSQVAIARRTDETIPAHSTV